MNDLDRIKTLERELQQEKEARKIAEDMFAEVSYQHSSDKENLTNQLEIGSVVLSNLQNAFQVLKSVNDGLGLQYKELLNNYEKMMSDNNKTKENAKSAREDLRQLNEKVPGMVINKAKEIITELSAELPEEFNSVKEILLKKIQEDYYG